MRHLAIFIIKLGHLVESVITYFAEFMYFSV